MLSTLDANCGYWKLEVEEIDRDNTAFTSHHRLYRFVQMRFGLNNAPGLFQRDTEVILSLVIRQLHWCTSTVSCYSCAHRTTKLIG